MHQQLTEQELADRARQQVIHLRNDWITMLIGLCTLLILGMQVIMFKRQVAKADETVAEMGRATQATQ